MWNNVQETALFLKEQGIINIDFGIILGTGLGNFTDNIQIIQTIPYEQIPHFPVSTVTGHHGELVYGKVGDKIVLAMRGRFHYYEGWSVQHTTFPVRVMKHLGVEKLIVSNASGGVNAQFSVGDIMLITDHINMIPEHPLRGENDERFGPRFVDMHEAYDTTMRTHFKKIAEQNKVKLQQGVYLALQGPTFETPAEYSMVRRLGGDAVGMSTVPEVIVAKHMGMRCLGISIITDLGLEGKVEAVSHDEVQVVARAAEKTMGTLVSAFIQSY